MKTKSLLTALTLPAIFAACTNEELVESIENQQPVQEIIGANLVNEGLSINVGSGIESRMTAEGDWTLTDKLGLGWLDAVGNITSTQSSTGTSTDATLYANHMFQQAEEGGDFTTYGNVYEGYHFAYYPYARMNKVEAKTIANVNVKQTEAFETDKYNKALWLSPQIYLAANDVKEDRLDTKKSFALNRVVNVLHVRTAINQDILDETALTALSFSSVTADLKGKAAFSLNANLNPRLLPVATYDEEKGEMVLDKEWTVANLVGVNKNFAIDRGSAATLTTEVEGDFASLSNSSISVRMFTLPTFNVYVAKTDVTFTFQTGAGYFTVEYTPTKDAAGKDVQLTAIQETNNGAIEKLLTFLSKEGFKKGEDSYTLQEFLGMSYPSLDFVLNKSMFTPDYSSIKSETDWNACVAIANALGNDDVTFNVVKSFAFTGEIQTPDVKNFYVTTTENHAITVGTAEGIAWPKEIKVPEEEKLAVTVAEDAVLNVADDVTLDVATITNLGSIKMGQGTTLKNVENKDGRVEVVYGSFVDAKSVKGGIVAYRVNANEPAYKLKNLMGLTAGAEKQAAVNTLVVEEGITLDLYHKDVDAPSDDPYTGSAVPGEQLKPKETENVDIELNGGVLTAAVNKGYKVNNISVVGGSANSITNVDVMKDLTIAKNASAVLDNEVNTLGTKNSVLVFGDIMIEGNLIVKTDVYCDEISNKGTLTTNTTGNVAAVWWITDAKVQNSVVSGSVNKLVNGRFVTSDKTIGTDSDIFILAEDAVLPSTAFGKDSEVVIVGNGRKLKVSKLSESSQYHIETTGRKKLSIENAELTFNEGATITNKTPYYNQAYMFKCPVDLKNVISDKSIIVGCDAYLDAVNITTLAHDSYPLWILQYGQTVNVNGCTFNSTKPGDNEFGRGIKIDSTTNHDEAFNGLQKNKVTLNVNNTTFISKNKGAVLVNVTPTGAEINWGEGNDISQVASDNVNAVWVDEAAKANFDKVIVDGCTKYQEPSEQ